MSIKESLEKIKPFYSLLVIILISVIFFAFGRLSTTSSQKSPINIAYNNTSQTASAVVASTTAFSLKNESLSSTASVKEVPVSDGPVIGSKSGKKYYFPWCGTVKRIKPENQVKFSSMAEARNAGFLPGGNCKGLK